MNLAANDYEIRYVEKDRIYDLFVQGRFKTFFRTFEEAVKEVERLQSLTPVDVYHETNQKGGRRR